MSEKGPSRSCGCDLFAPGHVEPHVDPILFIEHGERAYDDPLPHDVPGTGGWNGLYHESPDAYCLCGHPNYVTCERRKGWGLADLTLHNVGGAFVSTLPDTTADRGSAPEPTGDLRLTSPSGVCAVCARAVTGSRRLCGACAARRAS